MPNKEDPPGRHLARIFTSDADEHKAWISSRYNDHRRRVRPRSRGFEFFAEFGALGGLTVNHTRYTAATAEIDCPPTPYVIAGHLRSGRYRMRSGGAEIRVADTGTMLFPPYGYQHLHDCSDSFMVSVRLGTLLRVAEESFGLDRSEVRFTGFQPMSRAAERQWISTADYVRRGIHSRSLDQPLLLAAAEQLVAASLLSTFANTTMITELRTPRDPATPAAVRRAMAFIEAYAGRPITLTDIAGAAGVVPRTLQYAFRRHHDITPTAYLRRVRLARAHEELTAAQPGDGTTVAAVAARWGYARPHGFAAAYRLAYGRAPGEVLRS
jgi:AraC-like DNA-binding protein